MEQETTMNVTRSNVLWLKKIRDRLRLNSYDAALSKVKQTFKNLKLENEL